ncbi:MAG: type I restriction enzyme HsdR N-terminal domain-containing protein [Flavobacteriales bacterium]|nr:type I restriction enzyme HsdR N-terminal domain-containing protein [Flavobacteriales bacterium]
MIDPKKYPPLDLPVFDAKVRIINEVIHIHDDFRMKYVVLTPEEWVRQHFAHFLSDHLGYPKGRMQLEYELNYHSRKKRPDIGFIDRDGAPQILVECKAPDIALNEDVFLQIATYYSISGSRFLVLTNGLKHVYAEVQPSEPRIVFISELPLYQ